MSTIVWLDQISKEIPGFDLARCHWLRGFDCWQKGEARCGQLVLDWAGRLDVRLAITGISELPRFGASQPGALPYMPYDVGELLISVDPATGRTIIFDELKGWRIVAESVSFGGATPRDRKSME
jgi:hypothetical protein